MIDRAPTVEDARDLLAAEYVLGLMDPADLPQVEAFILRDADFAALVAGWRARLASLDFTANAVAPDPRLWAGVEAALGGAPAPIAAEQPLDSPEPARAGSAPSADRPMAASRPLPVGPTERAWSGLWRSLAFWRGLGLTASLAALLLAAGLGYLLREARREPTLIAVLMTPDGARASAIVRAFANGRVEMQPLQGIDVPPGKAIQIWTLWDPATGPKSVGLMSRASRATLSLEGMPPAKTGQIFEMTLEDAGGSPTGAPTGPVLNKGETTKAL